MSLVSVKINLTKKILESNNKYFIGYINSIFESQPQNQFQELPKIVQLSIKKGIEQSETGNTREHDEVKKKYKKLLKN